MKLSKHKKQTIKKKQKQTNKQIKKPPKTNQTKNIYKYNEM